MCSEIIVRSTVYPVYIKMARNKVVKFLLFISLMIFSMNALNVFLTDGIVINKRYKYFRFEYETNITVRVDQHKMQHYIGCSINKTFTTQPNTTYVIVYIKRSTEMDRTALRYKCRDKRREIASRLAEHSSELLYLAAKHFCSDEGSFVAEFLLRTIEHSPELNHLEIITIGVDDLNMTYKTSARELKKYEDFIQFNLLGYDLLRDLESLDGIL